MTLKENTCVEMVAAALHLGYRHLDTAQMYGNEREVGAGLRASGIKREEVFITTKVWFNRLAAGDFERSVDESLERLKLPWVDLLMVHWPNAQIPLAESIAALCKVKRTGLSKHIGVANFNVAMIDAAAKLATEPLASPADRDPSVSRPNQSSRRGAPARHGRGRVLPAGPRQGAGRRGAAAHRPQRTARHPAQVALRFLEQQSIIPIPRTSKRERLAENLGSLDFKLSDAEMAEIGTLKSADGRVVSPPQAPKWDT